MGYPNRKIQSPAPNIAAQAEKLQGLIDDRGSTGGSSRKEQVAVKVGDLSGYGGITLTSAYAAGAAPTAAEHDALVTDVRALAGLLRKMGADITWT